MFYAPSTCALVKEKDSGTDSLLFTDRVYAGEYWDEFSLTRLNLKQAKILVLGLGYGGCIRPLLAANPSCELTLVDCDASATAACDKFFAQNFPHLRYSSTVASAESYDFPDAPYDLIWLDLFTDKGYASCVDDLAFFAKIKERLAKNGVLAMNVFGLPTFFNIEKLGQVENQMYMRVNAFFSHVEMHPYRRNTTFICADQSLPVQTSIPTKLNHRDTLLQRLQDVRLKFPLYPAVRTSRFELLASFEQIKMEMWKRFADKECPLRPKILQVVSSPLVTGVDLDDMDANVDELLTPLPVLMASIGAGDGTKRKVFFDYLARNYERALSGSASQFVQFFLVQTGALLAQMKSVSEIDLLKFENILTATERRTANVL